MSLSGRTIIGCNGLRRWLWKVRLKNFHPSFLNVIGAGLHRCYRCSWVWQLEHTTAALIFVSSRIARPTGSKKGREHKPQDIAWPTTCPCDNLEPLKSLSLKPRAGVM